MNFLSSRQSSSQQDRDRIKRAKEKLGVLTSASTTATTVSSAFSGSQVEATPSTSRHRPVHSESSEGEIVNDFEPQTPLADWSAARSYPARPPPFADFTHLGSPSSSSDFETISDSERFDLASVGGRGPVAPSNLARSFVAPAEPQPSHGNQPSTSGVTGYFPSMSSSLLPSSSAMHYRREDSDTGEGDDEQSAMEEGEDHRGRGRTRRRRDDPVVRKGMLEDALRSSLATLLTLSAYPQTQSPAVSHQNLTALVSGSASPLPRGAVSPLTGTHADLFPRGSPAMPLPSQRSRASAFAYSLSASFAEEEDRLEEEERRAQELQDDQDAQQWEEDQSSTSSEVELVEIYSSGSGSDEEGTQLAPRHHLHGSTSYRERDRAPSRPIPIRSSTTPAVPSAPIPGFSPIQSRPLTLGPASDSPPTAFSRRTGRRRRGRRSSASPQPASLDQRRSARRAAAAAGDTDGGTSSSDGAYLDHLEPAFVSTSAASSVGTINTRSSRPTGVLIPPVPSTMSSSQAFEDATPDPLSSPSSFPSSDPALASSVPFLSDEQDDSPSRKGESRAQSSGPTVSSRKPEDEAKKGWFSWFGSTIELKVWHLVGIAGVLLAGGALGFGAVSFVKGHKPGRLSLFF